MSSGPWAQRCQLGGCAVSIRAPPRGRQDRSKVSTLARLAARQIVISARCFMNSHFPRKLVQGAEPFIGSIDAVTRYLSIPRQSRREWLLFSRLKLISVPLCKHRPTRRFPYSF